MPSFTLPAGAVVVPGRFGVPPAGFTDLFVADPASGTASVRGTTGFGGVTPPVAVSGLTVGSGASVIPGFYFGGLQFTDLLLYDPGTGAAQVHTTNSLGNITVVGAPTLPPGRVIAPGNFGVPPGPFTDLCLYDPGTGAVEVRGATGTGGLSLPVIINGIPAGATDVVPGFFAGGLQFTDLLLYDAGTGQARFFTTNGVGSITPIGTTPLPPNRRVVAGQFGVPGIHSDLFVYDAGAGTAQIFGANGFGGLSAPIPVGGLPLGPTWQVIPGFFAGGMQFTDLLFYDLASGQARTFTTNGLGSISEI